MLNKIVLLLLLLSLSYAEEYGNVQVNEVVSIYDGDTFRANIEGFPPIIGKRMGIRLNGIDTPEIKGSCQKEKNLARLAKQFSVQALRAAKVIELRNMKRGKYFRIVADVYVDGKNLSTSLINKSLAVEYHGGKKIKDWCK